ncbi:MAG: hypothetical protein ACKVS8_01270 [Phycisphaerales bacterium]
MTIVIIARIALPALTGSGSAIISISAFGSICHDTPKWSGIQPQATGVRQR